MKNASLTVKAIALAFALLIALLGALYFGWVFSQFWDWFIVPKFELPSLGLVEAMAITTMFAMFHQSKFNETKSKPYAEAVGEMFAIAVVKPTLFLGVGFLYVQFL